ncbi:MAG: glycosyltransferase family 39 protein [Solirubrobacteraceae bacterium]
MLSSGGMAVEEEHAPGLRRRRLSIAGARRPAVDIELAALVAIVLIAVVVRLLTIANQSIWQDEALTAYEAGLPLGAMLGVVAHTETTPPLYFVIIWGWAKVFGTGAVALRAVSALAGIVLVPVAYLSGRELVAGRAGLIAAAFVAVNPFMIWYSQEARAYMLLAALTGAGFLFFVRALRDPSTRNVAWWAALSALALMTHFFAGFAVGPEALWLLVVARRRAAWVGVGAVAAVQLAVLPFAFADTGHGVGWIAAVPRTNRVGDTALEWSVSLLYRRISPHAGLAAAVLALLGLVVLIGWGGGRHLREGAKPAAIVAGCALVLPLVLGYLGPDYFLSRNVIPAFPPLVVLAGIACLTPRAPLIGAAVAVGLLGMFVYATVDVQTHPYLQRPDWQAVAASLGTAAGPRAILASGGVTADPLKIYLANVAWVQPKGRPMTIREVDVVGATKRLVLALGPGGPGVLVGPPRIGQTLPRRQAPPGARLLMRRRVRNWWVARFVLVHPLRISLSALTAEAGRYFVHVPQDLLVFVAQES